ncbi:MAG: RNA polymerase sigma factor RpoD/SigA [Nitrospinae bacterium]|nr:RNA polymerase sigma factor RpoD/SigA [Nitrospinota bacterium]MBI3814016.1 RNA polymerase sigma factor RpoD/SigA [Nitrospinota bacterium]
MTSYRKYNQYDFNLLGAYLRDIGDIKPLSRKEEKMLADKGDLKSLNELVRRNLKYVVTVANRYKGCGLSLPDLIMEGNIGLIQAAKRFDPLKGVKFITYAIWWIRQAIMHALAEQSGSVRLPLKQAGMLHRISEKYREFFQVYEREPTIEDIAKELQISLKEVEAIMRVYRSHLSLDEHLKMDDDTSYLDMLEASTDHSLEEDIIYSALKKEVDDLLSDLTVREKKVLEKRYGLNGEPMTLDEIGKKVGLSRERIRQIEKKAKLKLASKAKKMALKDYLN